MNTSDKAFEEWKKNNKGLCMSSSDYANAAWNASRNNAIDEAIRLNGEYSEKPYEVLLHEQLLELKK